LKEVSFVFMVFHWPEPEHRDALAKSMLEMRNALQQTPGCIDVDPPYLVDHEGECLVGISKWDSREAFGASGLVLGAPDEIVEGETRPRQRFLLDEFSRGSQLL
jgi:Antibiotic biosynthesis monooxygenase